MDDMEKLIQLRNDYISCLKLARETDSKKEEAYLKQEAAKSLAQLREICPHNHTVCTRSEYGGSSSWDYDDRHPEYRICLCCGITDDAYDNKFEKLTTVPFKRFEGKYPDQIKNPLCYLLTEATEVAEKEGYRYFGGKL
jgi:hypothetical protein